MSRHIITIKQHISSSLHALQKHFLNGIKPLTTSFLFSQRRISRWHRELFRVFTEAQIKGSCEDAEALVRDDQLDRRRWLLTIGFGGRNAFGGATQAGDSGQQTNYSKVYEARSSKTSSWTELENVPTQSCDGGVGGVGL